jgi:hypothetical protein
MLPTSFWALFITRIDVKKSVVYGGRRQVFVEWEDQIQPEIKLNDASIESGSVRLQKRISRLAFQPIARQGKR